MFQTSNLLHHSGGPLITQSHSSLTKSENSYNTVLKTCDDRPHHSHPTSFSSEAGLCSAVGSVSDSRATGFGFDTWLGYILPILLPLIQEGQLSVTGECVCTKNRYWLAA